MVSAPLSVVNVTDRKDFQMMMTKPLQSSNFSQSVKEDNILTVQDVDRSGIIIVLSTRNPSPQPSPLPTLSLQPTQFPSPLPTPLPSPSPTLTCPKGHYVDLEQSTGIRKCEQCKPGKFNNGTDRFLSLGKPWSIFGRYNGTEQGCETCPNGYIAPSLGMSECEICPYGTQSNAQHTQCWSCKCHKLEMQHKHLISKSSQSY